MAADALFTYLRSRERERERLWIAVAALVLPVMILFGETEIYGRAVPTWLRLGSALGTMAVGAFEIVRQQLRKRSAAPAVEGTPTELTVDLPSRRKVTVRWEEIEHVTIDGHGCLRVALRSRTDLPTVVISPREIDGHVDELAADIARCREPDGGP